MSAIADLTFDAWMALVDREVERITGFSSGDFPPWTFIEAFESGCQPQEAAHHLLAEDEIGAALLLAAGINPNKLEARCKTNFKR